MDKVQLHYLEQLSEMYPTIGNASTEIINLQAILSLPKYTPKAMTNEYSTIVLASPVLPGARRFCMISIA